MRRSGISGVCGKPSLILEYVPKIPRFVKCFAAVLVISLLLILYNMDYIGYFWISRNFNNPYNEEKYNLGILREDLMSCFKESTKGKKLAKYIPERSDRLKTSTVVSKSPSSSLIRLAAKFSTILSSLQVKAAVIEPSVLYCMLRPQHQQLLLKRKFDISNFEGSNKVFTYGILSKDVPVLQEEENIYKFSASGFQPYFVQIPVTDWMKIKKLHLAFETFASHIFYKHKEITFHLVVFQERENYLWHAEVLRKDDKIPSKEQLLFANHNGAYERFAFIPLEKTAKSFANIYIPSMPDYFLFQMLSSHFLECDSSRSENISSSKVQGPKYHPQLSVENFNRRTVDILHQLKTVFHPLLMNLWIWSGTMLGRINASLCMD